MSALLNQEPLSDIIERLQNDGTLHILFRAGFITHKTLLYFEIAKRIKEKKIRRKHTNDKIIYEEVAFEFRVSIPTIYRAKKIMQNNFHLSDKNEVVK